LTGRAANREDHVTYELDLPDGRTLCTRISHPPNRTTYGEAEVAKTSKEDGLARLQQFWTLGE
jgi:hypothetical protein